MATIKCPNCHEFIVSKNNLTKSKYKGEYNEFAYSRGL